MSASVADVEATLMQCFALQSQLSEAGDLLNVTKLRSQNAIGSKVKEVKDNLELAVENLFLDLERHYNVEKYRIGSSLRMLQTTIQEFTSTLLSGNGMMNSPSVEELAEIKAALKEMSKPCGKIIFEPHAELSLDIWKQILGVLKLSTDNDKVEEGGNVLLSLLADTQQNKLHGRSKDVSGVPANFSVPPIVYAPPANPLNSANANFSVGRALPPYNRVFNNPGQVKQPPTVFSCPPPFTPPNQGTVYGGPSSLTTWSAPPAPLISSTPHQFDVQPPPYFLSMPHTSEMHDQEQASQQAASSLRRVDKVQETNLAEGEAGRQASAATDEILTVEDDLVDINAEFENLYNKTFGKEARQTGGGGSGRDSDINLFVNQEQGTLQAATSLRRVEKVQETNLSGEGFDKSDVRMKSKLNGDSNTDLSVEKITDKVNSTILDCVKKTVSPEEVTNPSEKNFENGSFCVAKWSSEDGDNCWYRARVDGKDGDRYNVTFLDYGNKALVSSDSVVTTAGEVPVGEQELVDSWVEEGELTAMWVVGEPCLVRWDQDNAWYSGVVASLGSASCKVNFTHYEGFAIASEENMLKHGCEDLGVLPTRKLSQDQELCEIEKNIAEINNSRTSVELSLGEKELIIVEKDKNEPLSNVKEEFFTGLATATASTETDKPESKFGEKGADDYENKVVEEIDVEELEEKMAEELTKFPIGLKCLAKWTEDDIWYRGEILSLSSCGQLAKILFFDYGNSDTVLIKDIKKNAEDIPEADTVDVNISPSQKKEKLRNQSIFQVGKICLARWSSDQVIYNAQICQINEADSKALVVFIDYGNTEEVYFDDIYQNYEEMIEMNGFEPAIDCNIERSLKKKTENASVTLEESATDDENAKKEFISSESLSLKSFATTDEDGLLINAKVLHVISVPYGGEDVKMALLESGTLVILTRDLDLDQSVISMWDKSGQMINTVLKHTVGYPAEIAAWNANEFIILSPTQKKIYHFTESGIILKTFDCKWLDSCVGLSVDEMGMGVTVNKCLESDQGHVTKKGETNLFYFDIALGKLVKQMDITDLVGDDDANLPTTCKSILFSKEYTFVVDDSKIYVLLKEDGEDQADIIESKEDFQFKAVSSVVMDDQLALLISDSGTKKILLFGIDLECEGQLEVSGFSFSGPAAMCLDRRDERLIVHDKDKAEIVLLSLRQNSV